MSLVPVAQQFFFAGFELNYPFQAYDERKVDAQIHGKAELDKVIQIV